MDWLGMRCAGCGAPSPALLCPACVPAHISRAPVIAAGITGHWTLGRYDGPLGKAVSRCKYRPDRQVGVALAGALGARARGLAAPGTFSAVVPAPSTARHRWSRGFALPSILATALSDLGPVRHVLTVTRGPQQAGLDARGRRDNLKGRVRAQGALRGRVLLVDDVLTTGATAEASARELLAAGASEVWLITLAVAVTRQESSETGVQNL